MALNGTQRVSPDGHLCFKYGETHLTPCVAINWGAQICFQAVHTNWPPTSRLVFWPNRLVWKNIGAEAKCGNVKLKVHKHFNPDYLPTRASGGPI